MNFQGQLRRMALAGIGLSSLAGLFGLAGCGQNASNDNSAIAALPEVVDYNFHVKPILSDRCFLCHGPDAENRAADLRLDDADEALKKVLESGHKAFVAGKPKQSEAFLRMVSEDQQTMMPPPDSNLSMSDYEIALIQRWIEQGAEFKKHWAYIAPERSEVPRSESWGRNDIDAFVLQTLEANGLQPSKEADKETLIRRVTFDLTGLPPTVDELDAFLSDTEPGAYERLVDGLLERVTHAERLATEWMDIARFGDTHGYSTDFYRDMSPYRDWVIEAFHENMPFDQFVTWQYAGDLLPNATREQRLATAFNRLHQQNGEGGIINEEFRVEYVADRIETLGTAFMGTTMQCVRCHDHKYDPITAEEYYRVFSFFNNIDDSGQISYDPNDMPVPTMLLPSEEDEEANRHYVAEESRLLEALEDRRSDFDTESFEAWYADAEKRRVDVLAFDALQAHYPFKLEDNNETIANRLVEENTGQTLFGAELKKKKGPDMAYWEDGDRVAIRLNGDDALYFPAENDFSRARPFTVAIEAWLPSGLKEGTLLHYNKAGILYNYKGFEISLEDGKWLVRLAHTYPYNSIALRSKEGASFEQWSHIALAYDGSSKAEGAQLYVDGEQVEMEVLRDNLYKDFKHTNEGVLKEIAIKVGARWRSKGVRGAAVDNLKVYDRNLSALEVAANAGREDLLKLAELEQWKDTYLAIHDESYRDLSEELTELRITAAEQAEQVREVMVMEEMPEPRQAYLLVRGEYSNYGKEVFPGTPEKILPFPEDLPNNRLGLAKWLVSDENPLTARVTVNRYWQMFFGRGIVATPEDFGNQGQLPTHPELLDAMARNFTDSGWDVRQLIREIVTSSTYRQSSKASQQLREFDPANEYLARGPQKRLSAEMIRDNALAASGLLVTTVGGPSVYPYQPDGLWKMNGKEYHAGSGDDLYRRSLYTIWKRTVPPPTMNSFDAPDRSYCVAVRQQTSTPLQSLALMNDPQFVEASRLAAVRALENSESSEEAIERLFRMLTSREPEAEERTALESFYQERLRSFEDDPERVKAYFSVGETCQPAGYETAEAGALGVLASLILNTDDSVVLR